MAEDSNKNLDIDVDEQLKREAIFRIGLVHSVTGRTIKVEVFKNKNHPYLIYNGQLTKNVATGSYIKVKKGLTTIVGKIEGEDIDEDKVYGTSYNRQGTKIRRFLNVSLMGHYENGRFYQGIKELPLIDNECYALEEADFTLLHNFFKEGELTINLGGLSEDPSHTIKAGINKLFASHIGIFGNTGSGKSNTLTRIYTELFEAASALPGFKKNSKFIFIDFNGEYTRSKVLSEDKKVYTLNTRKKLEDIPESEKYVVDSHVLEDAEILSVLLHATEKTQKPFLVSALANKHLDTSAKMAASALYTIGNVLKRQNRAIGVDVIYGLLNDMLEFCDTANKGTLVTLIAKLTRSLSQDARGPFIWNGTYGQNILGEIENDLAGFQFKTDLTPIDALQLRLFLHYHYKLSYASVHPEHVGPVIGRIRPRFEILKKVISIRAVPPEENIVVVSLRDVARMEIKKVLPLIICKNLYDSQKRKNDGDGAISTSLNIIIDEAHNILSDQSQRESEEWKDYRLETFEEIIKEGRKFGTFLTIASQRPYDISATIISQLHNYFIHRLINTNDLNAVRRAVAYLDDLSFDSIPVLSVGSCYFAGLATDIPIKLNVEILADLEKRPKSETVNLTEAWSKSVTVT
jgi:hypothetical protein